MVVLHEALVGDHFLVLLVVLRDVWMQEGHHLLLVQFAILVSVSQVKGVILVPQELIFDEVLCCMLLQRHQQINRRGCAAIKVNVLT